MKRLFYLFFLVPFLLVLGCATINKKSATEGQEKKPCPTAIITVK